jgi:hypothetical protein
MIPAGSSELRAAYHQHTSKHACSLYLLLFYAVECGLKSVYLRQNRLSNTDRIHRADLRGSHDLGGWIKELRLPASIATKGHPFRLERDGSAHTISRAHEAWRYGVRMKPEDEENLVSFLRAIHGWIKGELK